MIVALLTEKSGVGQRMLLADADRQGSFRFWAQTRSPLRLPRLDSTPLYGEAFARQIATIASRYDDVVIDIDAADGRDISGHFVSFESKAYMEPRESCSCALKHAAITCLGSAGTLRSRTSGEARSQRCGLRKSGPPPETTG